MNKSTKETEGKIIFVNSFKGGAGKTTLSLAHCIDALFHEKKYENVIYMDLDIMGTATCYLFGEGKLPKDKCFDYTGKPVTVELEHEGEKEELHVAYLNPDFKTRGSYGEEHYINHQGQLIKRQKEEILEFIRECFLEEAATLLVLDCAPGFSELEQALLVGCYQLMDSKKGKLAVLEEYVLTLDYPHVKKGITCLKDTKTSFCRQMKHRDIRITVNDIQNFSQFLQENKDFDIQKVWEEIAEEIKRELQEESIQIFRWRYSSRIALGNTYRMKENLENQTDDYLLTEDSYKEI